ncbi:MAG: EAL domain-containing protein [Methanoregulaceae archaeon]|nr:EAL domain-containing protein [Methanoregulaceae archaeon]
MSDVSCPVYLARQPIVDGRQEVIGYELLYRRAFAPSAGEMSLAEEARSLANALVEIGLNELVGKHRAFINVSEDLILSNALDAFPRARVVLEVLEHVRPTLEVQVELSRLRKLGYTIALDDFIWNDLTEPLIPYADLIKIDISQIAPQELPVLVTTLREYPVKLLAERVETYEEFERCQDLDFDYYQGYFFAKPQIVEGRALTVNHLALVRLLSRLHSDDLTLEELEGIIASEVQLNVRLLKFIKSAYMGLPSKVDSIRKALMFVGVKTLAAIATLLMMSQFANKPDELVFIAMVRAKMSELLAGSLGEQDTDRHFTVGMLSTLDALMDMPMADLLTQLPLSEEINEALLQPDCENVLAKVLRAVRAYEEGDFETAGREGVALADANMAYRQAVAWAGQTRMALAA